MAQNDLKQNRNSEKQLREGMGYTNNKSNDKINKNFSYLNYDLGHL